MVQVEPNKNDPLCEEERIVVVGLGGDKQESYSHRVVGPLHIKSVFIYWIPPRRNDQVLLGKQIDRERKDRGVGRVRVPDKVTMLVS